MAAFHYQALDHKGKTRKGVIEGDSARLVRQSLKEQGLIPVSVEASEQNSTLKDSHSSQSRTGGRMNVHEIALFTRQLSTLLKSGMPLESCLQAISEQAEKQKVRSVVTSIRAKVNEGYALAEGLAGFPSVFDQLYRAMVAAGEKSGHLDLILDRLANYTEHRQKMRSKVFQALLYPVVLVVFSVVIIGILLTAVVPKIVSQFVQTGQQLPTSTQVLIGMSDFAQHWWWLILLLIIGSWSGSKWLLSQESYRFAWDKRILTFPLLGKVVRGLNTARFARTLAICASSNIPILDAMNVAGDVVTNLYMKKKVSEATERVREGASLRHSLQTTSLFPPMMLHMIASGEQSGELEKMLISAADNQDNQFESTVNIALGLFTPILIAVMAGFVLFIVLATLMPILEMNNLMTR
ncbi:type II secretion system inner membrane protein GspF [Vibrio salinus]|uniref:type II secretion system inner membrane protein GspF n=1 Tax=Vibrio salinus TaxID=2899784 RepID=UPI001E41F05D|nr:type II secretion system inner membrane protein GspF [Vibrio salinus]MCE0493855.1 type II secretion system inner membrane protein GspF [Vibrio salinus]